MSKITNQNTRYEVIIQEDPETGDAILPIPDPILKQLNLKEGDELDFKVGEDGKLYVTKLHK